MAVGLDLDQYQLRNRVLLVFAPGPQDARYEEQQAFLLEGEGVLQELDVLVFGIFEDGPSFAEERAVSHEESVRERERSGVPEGGFGLALIDLDGTRILRSSEPLPVADLAEVVAEKRE